MDRWKPCVASTFLHHLLARICAPGLLLVLALAMHSELKILFYYHSFAVMNIILLILLYIGGRRHRRHWCRCLPLHNKSGDLTVQITLRPPRVVTYKIPLWMWEIASHKAPSASTMKPLWGCYSLHPVLLNHWQVPFAGCTVKSKVRPEEQQGLSNGHYRNEGPCACAIPNFKKDLPGKL
jgi:hypothetical protein